MNRSVPLVAALLISCSPGDSSQSSEAPGEVDPQLMEASVSQEPFGQLPSGTPVTLFTLSNASGMEVRAMNYGGIILSLKVPDRDGVLGDIALGYDDLEGYLEETPYFGAIIGRYGNRIAKGRFELDGTEYTLAVNDGENHLHGGLVGFDKVVWDAEGFRSDEGVGILFSRTSPHGEEGYPGNLSVEVRYTLTEENTLIFDYRATTDAPTPVNLTQHTYFNLAGHDSGDVLGHRITINAHHFTPVDQGLIPTGELAPVAGTPFDFLSLQEIGSRIHQDDPQVALGGGYDHNFVLGQSGEGPLVRVDQEGRTGWVAEVPEGLESLTPAARVVEPTSGRIMELFTSEPGLQFYSGNFLDGTITGKDGAVYHHRNGFCMETQHFPDSPNQSGFPSTILRPGEEYRSRTAYLFSVAEGG
jgi:aldose 1-epimerase